VSARRLPACLAFAVVTSSFLLLPAAADPPAAKPADQPDYALAARFLPAEMGKLVFDTSVAPHWFATSDKFWFSFATPSGTKYYLVDPALRSRRALWDNAKLAAELSVLTGFPYDAQHLPVKNMTLVDHDAALRFEVTVRRDAVLPGESPADRSRALAYERKLDKLFAHENAGASSEPGSDAGKTRTLYFRYDLATGQLRRLDGYIPEPPKPLWASLSPDQRTVIFARGNNLYEMDAANYAKALANPADPSIAESQLTTDGVAGFSYARVLVPEVAEALAKEDGADARNPAGMRAPAVPVHWSQDSQKFALVREDNRKVADLWTIHSLANPRPVLETYSYAMPGEANVPIPDIEIFTAAGGRRLVIPEKNLPLVDPVLTIADAPLTNAEREQGERDSRLLRRLGLESVPYRERPAARWLSADDAKLYFMDTDRTYREIDLCVADTNTGAVTTLIREISNFFLDSRPPRLVNHGQGILWWSERDGWAHYYLYNAAGKLVNPVTSGTYMSDQVVAEDDAARVLYFTAEGREPGEDPYYVHLYRVNLDGSGLKLLDPGNFSHAIAAPDDGKYFVDTFSRVNTAPRSVLLDDAGAQLADLAAADLSNLMAAGYKFPETFEVKAADGVTDLYGVMYKPFDFDPGRKYPLIEYVYPGPQTESVTKTFTPKDPQIPLAQLGFIVIEVGNRGGSPQRDKWYDTYGYGNLRDYGLADKKVAAEELAARYPFIDLSRVGIWGHSGGGFMTAAALLQYPDFFKAGWSESGNHENNVYNKFWSEKNDGVREEARKDGTYKFIYDIEKNSELAKNLKGHLMLTTGDMDDNVSMVNTMRLANALIHADKRFEMLVFPGMRHSYQPIASYVLLRRMDFFAHWLLGSSETGADILELQNEKQATPSKRFPE